MEEEQGRIFDIAMFPIVPGQVVRHEVPEEAELWQIVMAPAEYEHEDGTKSVIQQPYAVFIIRQMTDEEEARKAATDGFFERFGRGASGRGGAGDVVGADLPIFEG